ncbi:MAG: ribbon-helix-helix domain-containing protein [Myxococcaceae bacterium]
MKTAVSIPDPIFKKAEKAAKRLRLSRSELYARALASYVETLSDREVTEAMNRVYGKEPSGVDPALASLQHRSLKEDW